MTFCTLKWRRVPLIRVLQSNDESALSRSLATHGFTLSQTWPGTCVMPWGTCSGLLLLRRASLTSVPHPSPPKQQVLPMITRTKRKVATPALMYNMTLMCCVSSLMSSTLGTSIGGTRKPRAIPSCGIRGAQLGIKHIGIMNVVLMQCSACLTAGTPKQTEILHTWPTKLNKQYNASLWGQKSTLS